MDVPQPELLSYGLLVRTAFSAVSAGTERAKIETGKKTLLGKAAARPDLVKQVVKLAQEQGAMAAYQKVQARLQGLSALGYSCSGTVVAVGANVDGFRVGDRVACAGAGYANHAEINYVPRNLAVHVPDHVSLEAASLTTVGAIALHGFRQSGARLGEVVAIVGAGLVGILTMQIAKAAGCRVLVADIDPRRVDMARGLGCDEAFVPDSSSSFGRSVYGSADVAIITAAAHSKEPVELAGNLLRDRGQIVIVGDVSLDLSRNLAYEKELGLVLSRSYGPGRYDLQYEEQGIDYPVSYVRWTENRNMEAFVALLAKSAIDVAPLIVAQFSVDDATSAYRQLEDRTTYTAILRYPGAEKTETQVVTSNDAPLHLPAHTEKRMPKRGTLRVSCIGPGAFARDVIFPFLRNAKGVQLDQVASASGTSAESARRNFGFASAQSVDHILEKSMPDLLFVLTRHDSHARYIVRSLSRNIPVFVEKPLATNFEDLADIKESFARLSAKMLAPFVMVGFNRRFAPHTDRIREFFAGRKEPMFVNIRINAGYLPPSHWTHDHGGRIVGEFCHFVDWARSVVDSPIEKVTASALPDSGRYRSDNLTATLSFRDGSVAQIVYLANGDSTVAKERFEVFSSGRVAQLEDFRTLMLFSNGRSVAHKSHRDKGHTQQLAATIAALRAGDSAPISFAQLVEVTETTFAVLESLKSNLPVSVGIGQAELARVAVS